MRTWLPAFLLTTLAYVGCGPNHGVADEPQSMTAASAATVQNGVRAFAQTVAHDVTEQGPAAWRGIFADSPSFFMAADGYLAFPNSAAARAGIQDLARTLKHIELRWGNDLRVDPLTPNLAVVATSYQEVRVSADGSRVNETGYFTALAERRNGRWQFRNAHWSATGGRH